MKVAILLDPLSITMCMFVTGVSMLIHLYSIGYMKRDRDYSKFFIYLNLFVFSMLVLVLANNLLVTFVGWEGVGVCSYWLVAFWFQRETAASAGKKAFIYNRVGDVGFLDRHVPDLLQGGLARLPDGLRPTRTCWPAGAATAAVLLLFLAATGKSAQIPLFNWLPDAMEGPTPVSALIHAATMVTAGVYLLCRMNQLLELSPTPPGSSPSSAGSPPSWPPTIACTQQDIKKVLAFSTVSQIGYMILAVGCGAYIAAIFLMVCHAFYKALLFLGSGSVIHGLEDEQDLKRMGALRRWLPWTFGTFIVGWLAIAGVPPLSGFWSKGDVLDNVFAKSPVLWVFGLLTALRHRLLHEPALLPHLHRRGPLAVLGPRRPAGPPHPARVALGDAHPPGGAGRLRRGGRPVRPPVGPTRLVRGLAHAGLRHQHLLPPPGRHPPVGAWRSPTPWWP